MGNTQGPLTSLYTALKSGEVDRRTFIQRASMLGISTAGIAFLANTGLAGAQETSLENDRANPELVPFRPDFGTEDQERGAGGDLNLIQWQASTSLSPHIANNSKDRMAPLLILEPLMHYAPDATIIPNLVTEVPSKENGGLSGDLMKVTLKLLPNVVWSDGEPFTADDVVFTIEWVQNPDNNAVSQNMFEPIEKAEAIDDHIVQVTFKGPSPLWFTPFTGTISGFVYPKHILEAGKEAHDAFLSKPIGTGPYVVESFTPNDQIAFSINENYREPNKPFFSTVNIKGGGDAASAARAVLQTSDYDFAWNLQVEPNILVGMESESGPGRLVPYPGSEPENFNFNFSDPNREVDGQRSEMNTPHPFFSDDAVREAIATAIDRQKIADEFYGFGQPSATNVINGDPTVESPNTTWEFDLDKAAQILEDAGWTLNDNGIREKDGVPIKFVFATTVNSVRQKEQAVIKADLAKIGIDVQLEQVEGSIYFDSAAGTEQNTRHFYWDANMHQGVLGSPRPISYMEQWYAGPGGVNIPQKSNSWSGRNFARWQNEEYDKLFEQAQTESDPETFADLFIQMNDLVINNHVVVPLVVVGSPRGASRRLREENLALSPFSYDYWNIVNWNFADDSQ